MSIVSTVFSLLDFIILAALLVYAWRFSIAPGLAQQMQQEEDDLHAQEQKKLHFRTLQQKIIEEKKEQKEIFLDLQNKFGVWSGIVQEQYKQRQQEACSRQEDVERYTQQKKAYLQYHLLMRKTIPGMIAHLEHDIQLYYAHGDHAQTYFEKNTVFMKELV